MRCARGFEEARNDVLMILDGDLSVRPEDLPKFYRPLAEGQAELVNGSRLVYDVEPGAMRFLNMLGNKFFWRAVPGDHRQPVKDTLCGTKVLRRRDYERIAAGARVLRRVRSVRRLRPAVRRRAARPEDRRPARPLPAADVRDDEHQPLAPRLAAAPHDRVRVLEVPRARRRSARGCARPGSRSTSQRGSVSSKA